jgi:small subunit ribosomal protein SAe
MWWMLAREVLRMKGTLPREQAWNVMVDLFLYREPEDVEKEQKAKAEKEAKTEETAAEEPAGEDAGFNAAEAPAGEKVAEWGAEPAPAQAGGFEQPAQGTNF